MPKRSQRKFNKYKDDEEEINKYMVQPPEMPELHQAARAGDEARVRYLIEHKKCEVNEIDSWDSSALYYAVYAGNVSIVKYLLSNGAIADPCSFIGERCWYGALNDDIRKILKLHNATDFSVAAKHFFVRFLRLLSQRNDLHDFVFCTTNDSLPEISFPRVILGCRSGTLSRKFVKQWREKSRVYMRNDFDVQKNILIYLCTGRLVVQLSQIDATKSIINALQIDSPELLGALDKKNISGPIIFEDEVAFLRDSFLPLAQYASIPHQSWYNNDNREETEEEHSFFRLCCDLELRCSDGLSLHLPSIILRAHSDFVDAALRESNGFTESQSKTLDLFDATSSAVAALVRWSCCGSTPPELAQDPNSAAQLIQTAHRLLMPSELIGAAASALAEALTNLASHDPQAALDTLSLAQLVDEDYGNDKLYTAVVSVCANNLEATLCLHDFEQAVLNSARSIQERQDTDSIPLIDDLRSALSSSINPLELDPASSIEGKKEAHCLKQIDEYLDSLSLHG